MLRRTYDNQACPVAWSLEVVGERWTLLIVRDALTGITRFGDFRRRLGITASVLATRLDLLVKAKILDQIPYQTKPVRYDYRLTPCGRELAFVVIALMRWGIHHLADDGAPVRIPQHVDCGGQVEPRLVCRRCGFDVPSEEITTRLGHRIPAEPRT